MSWPKRPALLVFNEIPENVTSLTAQELSTYAVYGMEWNDIDELQTSINVINGILIGLEGEVQENKDQLTRIKTLSERIQGFLALVNENSDLFIR